MTEEKWQALFSRWLTMQAEWACEPEEARANQLTAEEAEIVLAMTQLPVPQRYLGQKLEVLENVLFRDRTSDWSDRRDELLLNSVKADVKALQ